MDREVVIKIPEQIYDMVVNTGTFGYYRFNTTKAIKNGTLLPKGHGALKDVDRIKTAFPCGEYVRTESVRATIDHEDTIIEAEKGAEK